MFYDATEFRSMNLTRGSQLCTISAGDKLPSAISPPHLPSISWSQLIASMEADSRISNLAANDRNERNRWAVGPPP